RLGHRLGSAQEAAVRGLRPRGVRHPGRRQRRLLRPVPGAHRGDAAVEPDREAVHRLAAEEPGTRDHRQPQDRSSLARRDEEQHGRADPPLQALHRGHPRAAGRGLCGRRASQGRVRDLPGLRRREHALPHEDPRRGIPAPGGARRDGARAHARRRRRHHRHPGHRLRRGRPLMAATLLSPEALAKIDRETSKYPPEHKRSAVMAALAVAQDEHGHLSTEVMDAVARHLGMAPVAVYEVATFYTMYDLEATGKYKLCICTNLPCALSGAEDAAEHLKKKLGVDWNETSADGRFTLKQGECFGACGDAPVILVNNKKMLSFMTPEKLDKFIAESK